MMIRVTNHTSQQTTSGEIIGKEILYIEKSTYRT